MKKVIIFLFIIISVFIFSDKVFAANWRGECACCDAVEPDAYMETATASCSRFNGKFDGNELSCDKVCSDENGSSFVGCKNMKFKDFYCIKEGTSSGETNPEQTPPEDACYSCYYIMGDNAITHYIWGTKELADQLIKQKCPYCVTSCHKTNQYTNKKACEFQTENPDLPSEDACSSAVTQIECQRLNRVWDSEKKCCKIYVEEKCDNSYDKNQCSDEGGKWSNSKNCCILEQLVAPIPYCYLCESENITGNKRERVWSEDGQTPQGENSYKNCKIDHTATKNTCNGVVEINEKTGEITQVLYGGSEFSPEFPPLGFGEPISSCSEMLGDSLAGFLKIAVRTLQGVGCVLAVMTGMLSMASAVASKDKEAIQKAGVKCVKLFIALALILLLPTIIRFVGRIARFDIDCI